MAASRLVRAPKPVGVCRQWLFTISEYRRYSWYVRLAHVPGGHAWSGIVRCEASGQLPTGDVKLYVSNNHHANWLDCIKSRKLPVCDVEIGHRSATVCHLGNIAIRTSRKIAWDPAKEEIVGDKEVAAMLRRPYRSPWQLG